MLVPHLVSEEWVLRRSPDPGSLIVGGKGVHVCWKERFEESPTPILSHVVFGDKGDRSDHGVVLSNRRVRKQVLLHQIYPEVYVLLLFET